MKTILTLVRGALAALALHYFLTPSESGSPTLAILIRMAGGAAAVLLLSSDLKLPRRIPGIFLLGVFVSVFFGVPNFPSGIRLFAVLFVFFLLATFVSALLRRTQGHLPLYTLNILLSLWVGSLLLQLLLFGLTGEALDLHALAHPGSETRITSAGTFLRLTGLMIEPGTYATWLFGLVLFRGLVLGGLFDRWSAAAVLSIYLTLSAWGAAAASIYFLALLLSSPTKSGLQLREKSVWLALVSLTAGAAYYYVADGDVSAWDYVFSRYELLDGSGAAKVAAYEGFRHLLPRIWLVGVPASYDFCGGCLSPQDVGFAVNVAVRAGLLAAAAICTVVIGAFWRKFGLSGAAAATPALLGKFYYYDPLVWLLITTCASLLVYRFHLVLVTHAGRARHTHST